MSVTGLDQHPVLKTIYGYGGTDKAQAYTAFLVYLDLCEAKGWWNTKTHVCEDLGLVMVSGHASRDKPREVVLPLTANATLSPAEIHKYIQAVKLQDYETKGLVLAICADDSSMVYYRVTDGLVVPDPPEVSEWKKYRREERPDLLRQHVGEQTSRYIKKQKLSQDQSEISDRHGVMARRQDRVTQKQSDCVENADSLPEESETDAGI